MCLGCHCGSRAGRPWPHYIAPRGEHEAAFGDFSTDYPAFARTTGQAVALRSGSAASILATTTLVWPTEDPTRFASIHSNPPWRKTDQPEVILNRFGAGSCIYCASPLETVECLSGTIVRLVRRLNDRFSFRGRRTGGCRADVVPPTRSSPLSTEPGQLPERPAQYPGHRLSQSGCGCPKKWCRSSSCPAAARSSTPKRTASFGSRYRSSRRWLCSA